MSLPAARRVVPVLAVACLLAGSPAWAQDTTVLVRPDSAAPQVPDSVALPPVMPSLVPSAPAIDSLPPMRRPISPGGALVRSLLVPGWGQARMGRSLAAGFFLAVEGAALGMALKANSELSYMREVGSPAVTAKSQEREDWLVIVGVNHLIAGIEAYVSAYLWDFPGDLQLRPTPNGAAATVTLPVRIR